MKPEETVEDLLNDLAARKGFDATWADLDLETRGIIREKWIDILQQTEPVGETQQYLDRKYDHVLKFNLDNMNVRQVADIEDYNLNQRICVNRNLHNSDTEHIKIKTMVKEDNHIYIAGDTD